MNRHDKRRARFGAANRNRQFAIALRQGSFGEQVPWREVFDPDVWGGIGDLIAATWERYCRERAELLAAPLAPLISALSTPESETR